MVKTAQMIPGNLAREKRNIWQVLFFFCMPSLQCSSVRSIHQSDRSESGVVIFCLPSTTAWGSPVAEDASKGKNNPTCHQAGVGSQKCGSGPWLNFLGDWRVIYFVGTRKFSKAQVAHPWLRKNHQHRWIFQLEKQVGGGSKKCAREGPWLNFLGYS